MYKSDGTCPSFSVHAFYSNSTSRLAKKSFSLTEAEMLTLPHECIANSPKSYFPLDAIKALAREKFEAGALLSDPVDEAMLNATVWQKREDNGRRNKGNWTVLSEWQIPGSRIYEALKSMKAKYASSYIVRDTTNFSSQSSKDSKTSEAAR